MTGSELVFFAKLPQRKIVKSSTNSEITWNPADGTVTVPINISDFSNVAPDTFVEFEIERRDGENQTTFFSGKIHVLNGITDD